MTVQMVFNAKQAAEYIGVSRTTFLNKIAPQLSRIRLSVGRVGYDRREMDALIESKVEYPEGWKKEES